VFSILPKTLRVISNRESVSREDIQYLLTIIKFSKRCVNKLNTANLLPFLRVWHILQVKPLCNISASFKSIQLLTNFYDSRSLAAAVPHDFLDSLRVTLLTFNHDLSEQPVTTHCDPLNFEVSRRNSIKIYVFIFRVHLTLILQLVFEDILRVLRSHGCVSFYIIARYVITFNLFEVDRTIAKVKVYLL
jgi:hypothetical protein